MSKVIIEFVEKIVGRVVVRGFIFLGTMAATYKIIDGIEKISLKKK